MTSVPRTGSISERAAELNRFLQQRAHGRGVNLMAHSMGGLDGRHLITHIQPMEYTPLSLTTFATPHRGSAFMDWCAEYLGLGRIDRKAGDKDKGQEMQAMAQAAHDVAGEHAKRGASASDANIGVWQQEAEDDDEVGSAKWECVAMLEGHKTERKSMAWSAEGNFLASCSRDKTVWVREALPDVDFERMGALMKHTQDIKSVAWYRGFTPSFTRYATSVVRSCVARCDSISRVLGGR
ncbi:hypothetical protein OF83DRAFT_924487 [Amylostereum chailletii]|nr:hypothetical protein OF83DRAFT_924487 [Amylostereum chailletii]